MNVPETDNLKEYMVLSYILDNPEECIEIAIENDSEKYVENILSHNSTFFDSLDTEIFDDLGGFNRMIAKSTFDNKEQILKTYNIDQSIFSDLINHTAENIIENKDDTIDYLIKNYRTGSLYTILYIDDTLDEIYDMIKDDENRLKKVLATLGYISNIGEYETSSYYYYFYSETEDIYTDIENHDMMMNMRFMFDYVYVEKLDYILKEEDSDIIENGIEMIN